MPAGQNESPIVLYVTTCQYRLQFYLYRAKYIKQLVLTFHSSWAAPGKPGGTVQIASGFFGIKVGSYKGQLTNAVLKHQPTSQREKPWNHFQNGMSHFSNIVFTTGEHFLMGQLAFSSSQKTHRYTTSGQRNGMGHFSNIVTYHWWTLPYWPASLLFLLHSEDSQIYNLQTKNGMGHFSKIVIYHWWTPPYWPASLLHLLHSENSQMYNLQTKNGMGHFSSILSLVNTTILAS